MIYVQETRVLVDVMLAAKFSGPEMVEVGKSVIFEDATQWEWWFERNRVKVHIYFEVDKWGNIVNPEIMNPEEVFPSLAEEVLRVVKAYPHKWTPAQKAGQAVASTMSLPISFIVP